MAEAELTVEILKEIRDDLRGVRTEFGQEIRGVRTELRDVRQEIHQRLEVVESTLLDLAEQQRFVVRYTKALAERDSRLDLRVGDLELRVTKLESK